MFKKIDGYYWVKETESSKIGYLTIRELIWDNYQPAIYAIGYLLTIIPVIIINLG
jgi:hypothetical protein